MSPLPRYVPDAPFPPYAFVPGRFPHPTRDPAGHRHGRALARPASFDPSRWRECRPYLVGIDLFNHGYYWEAHEAWESVWHACGRKGRSGTCLRALIRLAAAGVKVRETMPGGVRRHAAGAAALVGELDAALGPAAGRYMGLDLGEVRAFAEALMLGRRLRDAPPDARVAVVFDFALRVA